jgi:hypothetical protein
MSVFHYLEFCLQNAMYHLEYGDVSGMPLCIRA